MGSPVMGVPVLRCYVTWEKYDTEKRDTGTLTLTFAVKVKYN
jgi:hypothetical protein